LAKQLRVDVAELTDVGRRRTTNQDNLARRVPDDPEELERSGALFVVADGMGGHAAGEIASTVAVQTITNTYFQSATNGDVLQGLAHAIKSANEAILTIARQNAENTGMGTTLVAAVLCQGILYVANIGDSRAYLIRKGKMRQLTEDHSWVAEQVRAGVLTEEQARSHVHRNVITRSLGTQPNVVADVFVERAREGDILILCSDGLHGFIDDTVIADVAQTMEPTAAAQRLVDLANEAGGPDNITVSIVHISEISEASSDVLEKLQLLSDSPQSTRPIPIVAPPAEQEPIPAPVPPEPIGNTAPEPKINPRRRRRTLAVAARLVAVVALVAILTGIWYVTFGPFAQAQHVAAEVNNAINKTHQDIATLSSDPPAQQLALLAGDRDAIDHALTLNVTSTQRHQLQDALNQIAPLVTQALLAYNASAHIVPLGSANSTNWTNACSGAIQDLISLPAPNSPIFFGLNSQKQIVPVTFANSQMSCGTPFSNDVVALAAFGNQLGALIVPSSGTAAPTVALAPAKPVPALTTALTLASLPGGALPVDFAFGNNMIAVVGRSPDGSSDTVYVATGPKYDPAKATALSMTAKVKSLSFGGNNILYLLLDNGAIETYTPSIQTPHVVGDLQIQPALPISAPYQYTIQTPIPTVNPGQTAGVSASEPLGFLATPKPSPTPAPTATPTPEPLTGPSTPLSTATVVVADGEAVPHVVILDPAGHRAIVLQSSGLDLTLLQQYADASLLDQVAAATVAPDGHSLYLATPTTTYQITLP
jgi:serine/threonine protein phosphatase PrpC